MSRRTKPKRITNFLGAFLLETIAVAMFLFLFLQARAERQKSSHLERSRFPFIQEIAQQLNVEQSVATERRERVPFNDPCLPCLCMYVRTYIPS